MHQFLFIFIFTSFIFRTNGLRCHHCNNVKSDKYCLGTMRTCSVNQNACYTEVRNTSEGRVSITKSCYQKHACNTLQEQNIHSCPAVCASCCIGNLCNRKTPTTCQCGRGTPHIKATVKPIKKRRPSRKPDAGTRRPTSKLITPTPIAHPCKNISNLTSIMSTSPILVCPEEDMLRTCSSVTSFLDFEQSNGYFIVTSLESQRILSCRKFKDESQDLGASIGGFNLVCLSKELNETGVDLRKTESSTTSHQGITIFCASHTLDNESSTLEDYDSCGKHILFCFGYVDVTETTPMLPQEGTKLQLLVDVENKTASIRTTVVINLKQEDEKRGNLSQWVITAIAVFGGLILLALMANRLRMIKKRSRSRIAEVKPETISSQEKLALPK